MSHYPCRYRWKDDLCEVAYEPIGFSKLYISTLCYQGDTYNVDDSISILQKDPTQPRLFTLHYRHITLNNSGNNTCFLNKNTHSREAPFLGDDTGEISCANRGLNFTKAQHASQYSVRLFQAFETFTLSDIEDEYILIFVYQPAAWQDAVQNTTGTNKPSNLVQFYIWWLYQAPYRDTYICIYILQVILFGM